MSGRRSLRARLARAVLRLVGWSVVDELPPDPRYVAIGAPHTSNWDFPVAILTMAALEMDARWVGKHTLFRWPFGPLMRALGGVPVDRRKSQNFVQQVVERMRSESEFVLVIAPEGTRSRTRRWKTGFYHIAHGSEVPIALGFLDFARRRAGIGGWFRPSGDLEADMKRIREFYADKTGKRPEQEGPIRVRSPRNP